ncbi:MAG TPA: gamma subclass chorismate mutase AroQ [Porticoccaceae bacterium]|nr:gamma subclass chorismate mutase AroQ [Porticoccaceae bacterium]HCO59098.1 gamma subclass chorismate mutase AroQ [Porticoccaceae bacterium]
MFERAGETKRPACYLRTFTIPLALLLCSASWAHVTANPEALFQLLDRRLALMKQVAAYKYTAGTPVENRAREEVVLAQVRSHAAAYGLDPESVAMFFGQQMTLAKAVQRGWIEQWQSQGEPQPDTVRDIADTRKELSELGEAITRQLAAALPALQDASYFDNNLVLMDKRITQPFVTRTQKRALFLALLGIKQADNPPRNRLEEILHRGVLRVGTTGDYKPFSFYHPETGEYTGVDIELAADLARSLGVALQLVSTSWPTLMDDLAADRFDIGMSGISRTLQRQRRAMFSDSYSKGGKTPIGRCDNVASLASLEAIDQAGVRVIVNPGGTNEKFARQHIQKAQFIVHTDNTTVFQELLTGRADVMITDAIEVRVQTALHPELCATMPGELLTQVEKAFLMPQDIYLKTYVDAWLGGLKRAHILDRCFARYVSAPVMSESPKGSPCFN